MEVTSVETSAYNVGDEVQYRNHLREYMGSMCVGTIIDIKEVKRPSNGVIETYYIILDGARIRSVHYSSMVGKLN